MLTGIPQREAASSSSSTTTTTTTTKHTITGDTAPHYSFKGKNKRLKLTHQGEQDESTKGDMISGLPDDILSSILSLLPMKDEVKTSVLSTRWRFLWSPRPNLDFDIHTILGVISIPKDFIQTEKDLASLNSVYVKQVANLLELCRAPKIYSFKVSFCIDQRSACHLDQWIKSAIAMGVELLEINLSAKPYLSFFQYKSWYKPYSFPFLLLPQDEKTSTLKHLRLEFSILVCPPNFNGFNTLVTLELLEVKLNESSLESFFSSCLFLEILIMRKCTLPTNLKAVGPCVNLKCLEVSGCLGLKKILISATKLTSFKFSGIMVKISLYNVPRLKRLFVHSLTPKSVPFTLTRLQKDLPMFQSLYLSLTKEVPEKIASYASLKEVELQVFSGTNLLWIISTINALPHLLKLNLKFEHHFTMMTSTTGFPHNCLKEIEIYGFHPCSHMALVIYLLKNCVALERMIIDTSIAYYSAAGELGVYESFMIVGNKEVSYWQGGGKEKLYEVLNSEVPGRGELVTIRK